MEERKTSSSAAPASKFYAGQVGLLVDSILESDAKWVQGWNMMPFHQEGIVFGDPRWIRTSVPCVRGRNTRPLYERTTCQIG